MEEEGRSARGSEQVAVVQLEEAVELLVEHLVAPVLPLGRRVDREEALSPETQEIVARQVHATVLLYNYYHRKQFPQLEFASHDRFCMSTSVAVTNKNLLMYLNQNTSSVTDKAIMDACNIAEALDHTKESPDMIMWPISKVAVLLLNRTMKVCLLECGSKTKGVWSMIEKDISSDMSVQGLSNSMALPSEPYMLQQIAYSEVELKTGMKRKDLHYIEEHQVYSLSKEGTATMLFLLGYDQTVDSNLKEIPIDDALIKRMSGPLFESAPCPRTTSVVDFYHLLPYKEVLLNIVDRDWPLGSLSVPNEKEANSKRKSKMNKVTKHVVKADGDSGTNNCSSRRNRKGSNPNYKRKADEAFNIKVATYEEHGNRLSPTKDLQASVEMDKNRTEISKSGNVPQDIILAPDVDPVINDHASISQKENVTEKSGKDNPTQDERCSHDLQACVQMDKNITEKNSKSGNVAQDIIPTPDVDPVIKNHALISQKQKVTETSGGITNIMNNVQRYATLQLLQKMRDDTLREHLVLGDRSAEYEMDIQTILTETEMTPRVTSILKKYENSWKMMEAANAISSGEGCQTVNIKRKKLKEAILLRNKCQELDDICRESNWILPRYTVLPSVNGDMYQASVHLTGPDFNFGADGDMRVNPHEARDSAASNMLSQLQQKARED